MLKPYFTQTALLTSPFYFLNDTTFWVAIISHLTTLKKKLLLFCILADNGPLNALQKYILDTINYQQENILRTTSIYFLLTISPQNPTLRSQEKVKWSPSMKFMGNRFQGIFMALILFSQNKWNAVWLQFMGMKFILMTFWGN